MTLKTWQDDKLDWAHIEKCREVGVKRFKDSVAEVMAQLNGMIPDGRNVFFAHTMAGGIPKVKVFLAIANRIYKGRGERFLSSQTLLDSDLGKLILKNFDEVTANTFQHLIDGSAAIRARMEASAARFATRPTVTTAPRFSSTTITSGRPTPTTPRGWPRCGWSALPRRRGSKGIKATVYNCPEIRTNSSDIFAGVELSLFLLLKALKKEDGGAWAEAQWQACRDAAERRGHAGSMFCRRSMTFRPAT